MSKRDEFLDKLADRCMSDLDMASPNAELIRLYLHETRPEAAAVTTTPKCDPGEDGESAGTEGYDPRWQLADGPVMGEE